MPERQGFELVTASGDLKLADFTLPVAPNLPPPP